MEERGTHNPEVVGSSPTPATDRGVPGHTRRKDISRKGELLILINLRRVFFHKTRQ